MISDLLKSLRHQIAQLEAAVATRLLMGGVSSVVAMAYRVYAVAAAEFMTAFYQRLFAGDRVADAVHTGRRALFIARQSVLAGMGLSLAAMGVAALGYLPPVAGAIAQEVIDVAAVVNALRVALPPRTLTDYES